MSSYPFLQVDAFTDRPLGGNPCAVVLDADPLDAATMLAIAREMNLSETAFVRQSRVADFGVRYFTPTEEIPLAGHPTIATTFALVHTGRLSLTGECTAITLELPVGPIPVEILTVQGKIARIVMTQKKPQFLALLEPELVVKAFGLARKDLLPGMALQVVSTGTPQLMVPVRGLEELRRAWPDFAVYGALRRQFSFFSAHLFCLEGATPEGRTFARHFCDPPDLIEDPVTGSATGGMGAYLWRYGLIDSPDFLAEQGHWMHRPGQVHVEVVGPPEAIETVRIGGQAVVVLEGNLFL